MSVGLDGRPAEYVLGTLTTDLDAPADVLMVAAAVESVLSARGYVTTSHRATAREARLVGESADHAWRASTKIEAFTLNSGVRLRVTVAPLGDLAESQSITDAVLAALGE
ncbi:hypothetical protein BH11PLA1_BH11PLA1_03040 [soil metagenome]